MKQKIILLALLLQTLTALAQERAHFEYDNYGNRTERTYILAVQKINSTNTNGENGDSTDATGVQDSKKEIHIYPNPTKGLLKIEATGYSEKMNLSLFGSSGQLLQRLDETTLNSTLDLSGYPQGVYILRIVFGREKEEYKIIKE